METQEDLEKPPPSEEEEVSESKIPPVAAGNAWLKIIFWTFVSFSIFIIVNGNLYDWLNRIEGATVPIAAHDLLRLRFVTRIVNSYLYVAIACGIMTGIILAISKRLWAWLTIGILFVVLTAILNIFLIAARYE